MAGAGGQEVGRIHVRVVPNTDRYKQDAEEQLKRIEKRIRKVAVKVQAKFDETGLRQSILQSVAAINKENRAQASRKVRLYATLSRDGIDAEVRRISRLYQARALASRVELKTHLAASDFDVEISSESLEKASKQLEDWRKDNSPLKVDVHIDMGHGSTRAVSTRLSVLSRPRIVDIIPKVNEGAAAAAASALAALSGLRVLDQTFDKFWEFFKNLDKSIPMIGTMALAVAGLSSTLLTTASNTFVLAQSLAQIGPLALTLPGIFGGFALGLGATIAVLKDFNNVLPSIGPMFSALQDTMSANFWGKFADPMRDLIDSLFPAFSAGMSAVSTQLGGFFAGLTGGLSESLAPLLGSMFDNLSSSINIATQATGPLAAIIATLGEVGAAYLPQFAQWFVDITTSFSEWLTKARETGDLFDWIEIAKTNLAALGSVLADTGGILAGIARAADEAGGSGLVQLADTLDRVHATVDSPAFQTGLITALKGAHEAMNAISQTAGPAFSYLLEQLAGTLGTVLPSAGRALGTALQAVFSALANPAVQSMVVTVFGALEDAITALVPAVGPLGALFAQLGNTIAVFVQAIGPLLSTALTTLSRVLAMILPALEPVVTLLAGALLAAIQAITPAIYALVPILTQVVTQVFAALGPILPLIVEALAAIATAFVQILAAVAPIIPPLLQLVTAILTPLLPLITTLAQMFGEVLSVAIGALVTALTPFIEMLVKVVEFIMPILVPAIEFLAGILADTLGSAITGVADLFQGMTDVVMGIWNTFSSLLQGDWKGVWEGIKQVAQGIWELIKGAFKVLMNVGIFGVGKKVLGLLKGAWDGIWKAIKAVAIELWNSLKGRWKTFLDDLKSVGTNVLNSIKKFFSGIWKDIKTAAAVGWDLIRTVIINAFRPLINALSNILRNLGSILKSGWNGVKSVAKAAWNGILSGIKAIFNKLPDNVQNVIRTVKNAFANAGSWLLDAGKKIIQGLIDGISGMFGSVKDKLGDLTSKLTDWKGPEQKDRKLLTPAGKLVMKSFLIGLESEYDGIRRSLQGFTNDISGDILQSSITTGFSGSMSGSVNGALGSNNAPAKTFNYYAAAGSSISAEEDLFAALNRGRAVGI